MRPLEVGDTVLALVVHPEGPQGHAALSLRRAHRARRWQELAEKQRSGEVLEAPVVPLSQLASLGALDRPTEGEGVPGAVRALIGKDLTLKVIAVDPKRNRLLPSEKAATQQLRRQRKARAARSSLSATSWKERRRM